MVNDPARRARAPIVMIGWDAAEPRLVERWMDDGTLPNLARLRAEGAYGRLGSSADWLAGSVWPTFFTGSPPSRHGFYHYLQWCADRMEYARPAPDWLPTRPFWRDLGAHGLRAVALDVPMTYAPEPFDGIEVSGWTSHDRLAPPASHPPDALKLVRREFGESPFDGEPYGEPDARVLLDLRERLLAAIERVGTLGTAMLRREPADLYLIGFGATHTGGHKFWDPSAMAGDAPADVRETLGGTLRDLYIACDGALGRLRAAAGPDSTILVFSLHGMGDNASRAGVLATMLERVLSPDRPPARPGLLKRLRTRIPERWRYAVKSALPVALQDRLTAFWRVGGVNWGGIRAFPLLADLQGYVRLNLRGREAAGTVEPGPEADELCARIADALRDFVDADTGEPVVDAVVRGGDVFPAGPRRQGLPDLVVRWAPTPAARHRALHSPRHGTVPWPTPGRNPDERSGNHRPHGFLAAAGPAIPAGGLAPGAHIVDLAPTALALLGVDAPASMTGRPLFAGAVPAGPAGPASSAET